MQLGLRRSAAPRHEQQRLQAAGSGDGGENGSSGSWGRRGWLGKVQRGGQLDRRREEEGPVVAEGLYHGGHGGHACALEQSECRCGTHGIPRKEGKRPSLIRIIPL